MNRGFSSIKTKIEGTEFEKFTARHTSFTRHYTEPFQLRSTCFKFAIGDSSETNRLLQASSATNMVNYIALKYFLPLVKSWYYHLLTVINLLLVLSSSERKTFYSPRYQNTSSERPQITQCAIYFQKVSKTQCHLLFANLIPLKMKMYIDASSPI